MSMEGDILPLVLVHLPLDSVPALRRTSKSLHAATRLRALWAILFRTHVLDPHIPYPHQTTPIPDLSAEQLESLVRRAITLRRNWTSSEPVPRRRHTLDTPTEPPARIIFLQFLPGRSNRWLLSVRMTVRPRTYLLQCWDTASDNPTCIAVLRHADGPYGGVVLNSDPDSPAVFAFQSAQTETFSIDFDADDPESAFVTETVVDGIRELHLLSRSVLVTRHIDQGGALSLWHLDDDDLSQESIQLLNPAIPQPDDRVQAIHLAHDYALVVRAQSIDLYSTTPRPSLLSARGPPIAYPLAQFKLHWRTDTVVLSETQPLGPLHLFIRFGSIYPWPVNVLHHYLLSPNPAYTLASTTEYNLPYDLCPTHVHTISSPVRLFGQSAMACGRYGTALWLDNYADAWHASGPSERGQRLAGTVLDPDTNPNDTLEPTTGSEPTTSTSSGGASMLFGTCDDDVWTRIAMEEEAGRIAIGHTDGAITLLEY